MKKNTLNNSLFNSCIKVLIAGCVLMAFSCKSKKALVKRTADSTTVAAVKPVNTKAMKLTAIRAKQTAFNTFNGKASTKLDINGNSNNVTLNIRIQHNKKIWVSITAIAGIEVARALITPDSLLVINKLQSVYLRKPFSYIYKFTGRSVNYGTVESLLIGNAIPELLNENADFQTLTGNTVLSGTMNDIIYKLILGPDLKATQTNLNNQAAGQSLQVVNGAFVQAANKVMPSQINISSAVKDKKVQINMHYSKTEFDQPLEFPFSIPSRYTPAAD